MPDNGSMEKLRTAASALSAVADLLNETASSLEGSVRELDGRIRYLEEQTAKNDAFRKSLIATIEQFKD